MGENICILIKIEKKKKQTNKVCPERCFSVSQLFQIRCGVICGEYWRRLGTGLTKIFSFLCYLEVVSIEAMLFLFACAAYFGNMDNDIAKQ